MLPFFTRMLSSTSTSDHLAGDPRRDEGHVPVDIRIVGGNRVQCRLDRGDEQVSSVCQPAQDGQQDQTLSQGVSRPRGIVGRRRRWQLRCGRRNRG